MRYSTGVALLLSILSVPVSAAPPYINFQAVLTDAAGKVVPDNVYAVKFRIWDDSVGGAIRWETAGYVPVQSTRGLIQHLLGGDSRDSVLK